MKVLITGGLGYIGSHISHLLKDKAIILDNKINSTLNYKKKLPNATVYIGQLNKKNLNKIFSKYQVSSVIHLAGLKSANDSVKNPLKYYKSNIIPFFNLLESMKKFKVKKIIFSSSATVYGSQNQSPLKETMKLQSINPYGSTKIVIENLIDDFTNINKDFKAISLRYFNPLGANTKAKLSEKPLGTAQNIMPTIISSVKKNKVFKVFGDNYNTKDGSCLRDYIHVEDLAKAHVIALKKISYIKGHNPINIGLGKGVSVFELIKIFEKTNKVKLNYKIVNKRKGDISISFADTKKAKKILKWKPKYKYSDMVKDAWKASFEK